MKKEDTKKIGEVTYQCTQLHPKIAMRILSRLIQKFGGPMGVAMDSGKSGNMMDADIDIGKIMNMIGQNLKEDDLWDLCEELCQCVIAQVPQGSQIPGGQLKGEGFENHFSSSKMLLNMIQVAAFSLEVNFKDFLLGIKEKVQSALSGGTSTSDA